MSILQGLGRTLASRVVGRPDRPDTEPRLDVRRSGTQVRHVEETRPMSVYAEEPAERHAPSEGSGPRPFGAARKPRRRRRSRCRTPPGGSGSTRRLRLLRSSRRGSVYFRLRRRAPRVRRPARRARSLRAAHRGPARTRRPPARATSSRVRAGSWSSTRRTATGRLRCCSRPCPRATCRSRASRRSSASSAAGSSRSRVGLQATASTGLELEVERASSPVAARGARGSPRRGPRRGARRSCATSCRDRRRDRRLARPRQGRARHD